jgi:hypothetical protein
MVRLLLLVAAFAIAAPYSAIAKPNCTQGSEFEPPLCSRKVPAIARVVIEANAAKSSVETDASVDCSAFVVTEALVRRYLRRAKRVPGGTAHSMLDWSACHASGTVEFSNGQSAKWNVSQLRVGSLVFDGQPEQTLFCPTCREQPFAW